MANLDITNIDLGDLALGEEEFRDETLNLGGAAELVRGTILARDSVSLKLVLFVKGGATNENGIPKAVLAHDVSASGAGDVAVRAMVKGKVNKARLVIDADGDDSNIDAAVVDQLRDYGITPVAVDQHSVLDNQ